MADSGGFSGFRNIKPMTRDERRALKDKVALEKDRLMKRSGMAARMYRENAPGPDGLTCMESTAAGYLADADRFHSDVSGEELLLRQQKHAHKQQIYDQKRIDAAVREEERWKRIEEVKAAEEEYWKQQRALGHKARKNSSCVPYDTVTLKYDEGKGGEELRYQDDLVRYRAALRSQNLMVCGDTRVNYDIINGSGRPSHVPPPMPQPHDIIARQQGR